MVSSEIREAVLIAISAILLSVVLGFVSFLINIRNDMADARNSEIYASKAMSDYREFNKYDSKELFGEDVVAAVKDYYESGVTLRVVRKNSSVFQIDKYTARLNPTWTDTPYLQSLFPTTEVYKSVLVYGQQNLSTITKTYTSNEIGSNITAIVFFYERDR